MIENYVIWQYKTVAGACGLQDITGFEKTNLLSGSHPIATEFPEDVALHMHKDFVDDLLLTDNVLNLDRLIIASARLKSALEAQQISHVEYLPVRIIDHRGRVASKDYFIVHPINHVARIDEQASDFKMSMIKKDRIQSFKRLVLDKSSIPDDRKIFNLHNFTKATFVRRDLANALSADNFSGLGWSEIADYSNLK